MPKQRYVEGDVFAVPLRDGRKGFGQVAAVINNELPYLIAYKAVSAPDGTFLLTDVLRSEVLALANFIDTELLSGAWEIVARAPVPEALPFPATKVVSGGQPVVKDVVRGRRRAATPEEMSTLPPFRTHSPSTLLGVLQASAGLEPWEDNYEEMLRPRPEFAADRFFSDDADRDPVCAAASGSDDGSGEAAGELCLLLHYRFPSGQWSGTKQEQQVVLEAQDAMDRALTAAGAGDVDGYEIGEGEVVYYVYGGDCARVWEILQPVAEAVPLRPAFALLEETEDGSRRQLHLR